MSDLRQYLTFRLGSEEFGLEILRVQEIKGFSAITPIPASPPEILGVINLRGTVVPVVDLRRIFGMPAVEPDRFSVIIVVRTGERISGLIVDAVSDVLDVPVDGIEPPPDFGSGVDVSMLAGLAKSGERLVLLLDIDRLVGDRQPAAAA